MRTTAKCFARAITGPRVIADLLATAGARLDFRRLNGGVMKKLITLGMLLILSSMTISPAQAASSTFYLKLKANSCYSFTKTGTKPASIELSEKNMYAVSCSKPHHFEVIRTGQVPAKSGVLTQEDMSAYCGAAFSKKFGKAAPSEITEGAIYLRWFFPDAGLETKKYKNQGVCIAHKSDSNYSVYSVLKAKLK